ncbi:MAG: AAA family ATPase [Prevotella sp.]|nr:AAA family ATPase [Prevotella sp.]
MGKIYVDKSDLVAKLTFEEGFAKRPIFLSRPRRFGKSLLCSTFRSLFEHGVRDFKDLKLEHSYQALPQELKDAITASKVIYLDFSTINKQSIDLFEQSFCMTLKRQFKAQFGIEVAEYVDAADLFVAAIDKCSERSVVLLIDEYDAPLTHRLKDQESFKPVLGKLETFYQGVKSLNSKLLFTFITGVVRFSHVGLFSGVNHANDITLEGDYATLLGYTKEEIVSCFRPFLEQASLMLQCTTDDVLEELARNYDGYRMSADSEQTVFAPWSVLNFLIYPKHGFRNYWYGSGGQSTLLDQFFQHRLERMSAPDDFDHLAVVSEDKLSGKTDLLDSKISAIAPEILLTQAGYLTIKEVRPGGKIILGTPNQEVRNSLARLYTEERYRKGRSKEQLEDLDLIGNYFAEQDLQGITRVFDIYLSGWSYDADDLHKEASFRDLIYLGLISAGLQTGREVIAGDSRSDLEVILPETRTRYVFEFKTTATEAEIENKVAEARKQLQESRYGELPPVSYSLKRLYAVIDLTSRRVVSLGEC